MKKNNDIKGVKEETNIADTQFQNENIETYDNDYDEETATEEDNSSNKNKLKLSKKKIYNLWIILFLMIFIGCAIYLFNYFWSSKKSEDKVDEIQSLIIEDESTGMEGVPTIASESDAVPKFIEVDGKLVLFKFSKIYHRNNDFVGWISIKGTDIDYPVMQTMNDEEYYLRKDFDKEYSLAGSLFIDTSSDVQKPSSNILLYGHNMKTGKMFADLLKYEEESFYNEHKYITFDTIYGEGTYEVIAAFRTEIHAVDYSGFKYYQFFDAVNEEEFNSYVDNCKALTPYEISADAEYGDSLISLSTCAYHSDHGRYVVVAKKID